MEFKKKTIKLEKIAFINHTGHVEDMTLIMEKLFIWIQAEKVRVVGPPFALYYTDPSMVEPEYMVYDMCIPIEGDYTKTDEIDFKEIPEHTVISSIHKGEYNTLGDTYMGIWNYIQENKYEPNGIPKEIYLNNPYEVDIDDLLTEIQFPIN